MTYCIINIIFLLSQVNQTILLKMFNNKSKLNYNNYCKIYFHILNISSVDLYKEAFYFILQHILQRNYKNQLIHCRQNHTRATDHVTISIDRLV